MPVVFCCFFFSFSFILCLCNQVRDTLAWHTLAAVVCGSLFLLCVHLFSRRLNPHRRFLFFFSVLSFYFQVSFFCLSSSSNRRLLNKRLKPQKRALFNLWNRRNVARCYFSVSVFMVGDIYCFLSPRHGQRKPSFLSFKLNPSIFSIPVSQAALNAPPLCRVSDSHFGSSHSGDLFPWHPPPRQRCSRGLSFCAFS